MPRLPLETSMLFTCNNTATFKKTEIFPHPNRAPVWLPVNVWVPALGQSSVWSCTWFLQVCPPPLGTCPPHRVTSSSKDGQPTSASMLTTLQRMRTVQRYLFPAQKELSYPSQPLTDAISACTKVALPVPQAVHRSHSSIQNQHLMRDTAVLSKNRAVQLVYKKWRLLQKPQSVNSNASNLNLAQLKHSNKYFMLTSTWPKTSQPNVCASFNKIQSHQSYS